MGTLLLATVPAGAILTGAWQYPIKWDPDLFGYRFAEYVAAAGGYHLADDMGGIDGMPVTAAANGTVVRIENWPDIGNYGGLVLIEHENPTGTKSVSLYGHLDHSTITVTVGEEVQRGKFIGELGDSAVNGGWPEHIHFGISRGAYQVTPWIYYGYGPADVLGDWEDPTKYIGDRVDIVEVERVPEDSPDRYVTAAGVSALRFPAPRTAQEVLLGSGQTYVDALAGNAVSTMLEAPILLTKKDVLPASTVTELQRVLAPGKTVKILGGTQAVTANVERQIIELGYKAERVAGQRREATAAALASLIDKPTSALVTSGWAFADAVSSGTPAAANQIPLLLTRQNQLSDETRLFLETHPTINTVSLIGGPLSVSDAVAEELLAITTVQYVNRVFGEDRYATNAQVATVFKPEPKAIVTATGEKFADALAGASLAASLEGVMLLSRSDELPTDISEYLSKQTQGITVGLVLGGPDALTDQIDRQLSIILNSYNSVSSLAGELAAALSDPAPNWQTATVQTLSDGLKVPVPIGFEARTESFRDARVTSVERPRDTNAEIAPPLVVTELSIPDGKTAAQVIQEWFGSMEIDLTNPDLGVLPGLFPAQTSYEIVGNTVVITQLRSSATNTQNASLILRSVNSQ